MCGGNLGGFLPVGLLSDVDVMPLIMFSQYCEPIFFLLSLVIDQTPYFVARVVIQCRISFKIIQLLSELSLINIDLINSVLIILFRILASTYI